MTDEERKNRYLVNIVLDPKTFDRVYDELRPQHRFHNETYVWQEYKGRRHFVLDSPGGGQIVFVIGDRI